jgi:hypothetical protein
MEDASNSENDLATARLLFKFRGLYYLHMAVAAYERSERLRAA